jgi:hypothetical protein
MPISDSIKSKSVAGGIPEKIRHFLNKTEFLNIATCDFSGRPNVAPKFLMIKLKTAIYILPIMYLEGPSPI